MADYKELLRRAVDALPENNGMSRRAVYEKAREALVTQLRAIEPPLPAREITQHRLALEDCIRQVEQEATEALLKGLKEETEVAETPVFVAPVAEPSPEPVEPTATTAAEPSAEKPVEPEETPEPEPNVEVVEEPKAEATAKSEEPETVEPETTSDGEDTEKEAEETTEAEELETASPEATEKPDADVSVVEDVPIAEPEIKVVDEPTSSTEPDAAVEPAPVEEKKSTVDVQPGLVVDAEIDKADKTPAETEVQPTSENKTALDEPDDKDKSAAPKVSSVDEVIAAARAASAPTQVGSPKVELASKTTASDVVGARVEPALSSVREVDVDESVQEPVINVDGEEPQAAIDRAIKALDLEAEGKDGSDLVSKPSDDAKKEDEAAPVPSAKDLGKSTTSTNDDDALVVEDETTGGNGLTVFLLLVIVLLAGAGGGAYWAWKEGYVDLNPLMAQLGFDNSTTNEQSSGTAATDETTTPSEEVPTAVNVRDVTPTTTNASDVVENTPVATVDERLTAEPEPVVEPEPEVAEVVPTETVDETPTEEVPTPAENTDTGDERLQAEEVVPADTEQPTLNVEDTNAAPVQVGSRSMLIEEQVTGSGGAVPFTGSTQWSRDVDELGAPVIKASVSVPARNLSVDVLIRKNSDSALPASHLVEVNFTVTDSFLGGGIASLPGILLKNEELAQGTPLVGASARIFDNSFLFALSAADADLVKNLGLLSERGWIDFPVVYSTGRKAIVTLEKGTEGSEIFEAVLAAWAAE